MQQPSQRAIKRMVRRAWILPALLALTLVASILPVSAHTGGATDWHASAVAEGGSTLHTYDPPGLDPSQEFWLDANLAILHRQDCTTLPCKDYYRATFKVNSWRGVFTDDDTIMATPGGDNQYIQYYIRVGLYQKSYSTGIVQPLQSNLDAFLSGGNFSYGCHGTGRETLVTGTSDKQIFAQLWVWGARRYYYMGNWYYGPAYGEYWHMTRSKIMDSLTYEGGHFVYNDDALSGAFVRPVDQANIPNAVYRGACPFATTEQP
jgi:hypothetical protein